ncbi:uncharacterized protein LOC131881552 isoform X2 [Tigriopus californicus]|uniref:uncharacterized protein LOC131881552 isoform X2 n=1 Tax=Tigriopus californicus TaxID=6832 RepID=UPI0027DA6939|nr:uncharacterized protein LOC131881552 isoform X2 [Tigriopus californicus]
MSLVFSNSTSCSGSHRQAVDFFNISHILTVECWRSGTKAPSWFASPRKDRRSSRAKSVCKLNTSPLPLQPMGATSGRYLPSGNKNAHMYEDFLSSESGSILVRRQTLQTICSPIGSCALDQGPRITDGLDALSPCSTSGSPQPSSPCRSVLAQSGRARTAPSAPGTKPSSWRAAIPLAKLLTLLHGAPGSILLLRQPAASPSKQTITSAAPVKKPRIRSTSRFASPLILLMTFSISATCSADRGGGVSTSGGASDGGVLSALIMLVVAHTWTAGKLGERTPKAMRSFLPMSGSVTSGGTVADIVASGPFGAQQESTAFCTLCSGVPFAALSTLREDAKTDHPDLVPSGVHEPTGTRTQTRTRSRRTGFVDDKGSGYVPTCHMSNIDNLRMDKVLDCVGVHSCCS